MYWRSLVSLFLFAQVVLSATSNKPITIVAVERNVSTTLIQKDPTTIALGDYMVFHNELYDSANKNKLGTNQGSCQRVLVGYGWDCGFTAIFTEGNLAIGGLLSDKQSNSTFAILGGTGKYKDARGYVTYSKVSDTVNSYTYYVNYTLPTVNTTTIAFVERDNSAILPTGINTVGDYRVFNNDLYDNTNGFKLGSDQGSCVRTSNSSDSWECEITLYLEDGQITTRGAFSPLTTSTFAIIGGTSNYATIRGQFTITPRNDSNYNFSLTIDNDSAPYWNTTSVLSATFFNTYLYTVVPASNETENIGDRLVFALPLLQHDYITTAGNAIGSCIRVIDGKYLWECEWTLVYADGSVTIVGPFNGPLNTSFAITGGTGSYKNVRGDAIVGNRGSSSVYYDITLNLWNDVSAPVQKGSWLFGVHVNFDFASLVLAVFFGVLLGIAFIVVVAKACHNDYLRAQGRM